jgi:hypothetical protein
VSADHTACTIAQDGGWSTAPPDGLVELSFEPSCYTERRRLTKIFTRGEVKSLTLSIADADGLIAALRPPGQR